LQILTNAQSVEGKTTQHHHDRHQDDYQPSQQTAAAFNLLKHKGGDSSESDENAEEILMLENEDKRVLNKRKKRTTNKVEECNLDLDSFITLKKRQRVDQIVNSEDDTTIEGAGDKRPSVEISKEQRDQIKKKLIEKYFSELPEQEHTRTNVINYVKYMLKNIQLEKLTISSGSVSNYPEESLLMDWILENDPNILVEICKFWIYHAFSLCPSSDLSFYLS